MPQLPLDDVRWNLIFARGSAFEYARTRARSLLPSHASVYSCADDDPEYLPFNRIRTRNFCTFSLWLHRTTRILALPVACTKKVPMLREVGYPAYMAKEEWLPMDATSLDPRHHATVITSHHPTHQAAVIIAELLPAASSTSIILHFICDIYICIGEVSRCTCCALLY